jgi:hypothetical protein
MVEKSYWLVIDCARFRRACDIHSIESRFHTFADCRRSRNSVALKSGKERMTMTFASLDDAVMQESLGTPSTPLPQTTIFRWMSAEAHQENLHVAALNPGSKKLTLAIRREKGKGFAIEVTGAKGCRRSIRLTSKLKLKK